MKTEYSFGCTLCGECCSGSMQVFLNSYDLYKMGRFLKLSGSGRLFEEGYILLAEGQNGLKLPMLRFKTEPYPFCPFLINDYREEEGLKGLCSLHLEHKPLVCRLAPLSRRLDLDKDEEEFDFILPHAKCPGKDTEGTIRLEEEKTILREELDFERRYYRLLSLHEQDPAFLWDFPLNRDFKEILAEWEMASGIVNAESGGKM